MEERDGNGDLLRKFAYGQGIGEILWMEAPDQANVDDDQNTTELMGFHYHTNSLGSVTHLTDPSESVVEKYEYTPYGQTTVRDGAGADLSGISDVGNPHMYTARRLDGETVMYYYRARTYNPNSGRFLQHDPIDVTGGINTREYCWSNPVILRDPRGLYPRNDPGGVGPNRNGRMPGQEGYGGIPNPEAEPPAAEQKSGDEEEPEDDDTVEIRIVVGDMEGGVDTDYDEGHIWVDVPNADGGSEEVGFGPGPHSRGNPCPGVVRNDRKSIESRWFTPITLRISKAQWQAILELIDRWRIRTRTGALKYSASGRNHPCCVDFVEEILKILGYKLTGRNPRDLHGNLREALGERRENWGEVPESSKEHLKPPIEYPGHCPGK